MDKHALAVNVNRIRGKIEDGTQKYISNVYGMGITYRLYQSMNYMNVPFEVPVIPILSAAVCILLICILVPVLIYKQIGRQESITKRMKNTD